MSGGDLINAAVSTEELEVSATITTEEPEISAVVETEEPEIAATLSDLRYLVFQGLKGDTGDSAYDLAVELGFVGTEAEWLASLKGEKGDTGFSPEITSSAIPGGHRIDIYNELGPDSFNVMDGVDGTDGEDGTDGVSPTVTVADITGGHRVTITDATHPQGLSIDVMDGDPGDDYVLTPQDKVEIAGMVPVPTVPTEDISANTAARHTHENKAVLDGITAAKVQSWDGKGTYSKPSGGIPASDLASGVIPDISGKVDKIANFGLAKIAGNEGNYSLSVREGENSAINAQVVSVSTFNTAAQTVQAAFGNYYTKTEFDEAAALFARKSDIVNMYKYKGSVATVSDLPSSGVEAGWVYNVEASGMNYAWNGSAWDALGETFSITAITNAEIDTICT